MRLLPFIILLLLCQDVQSSKVKHWNEQNGLSGREVHHCIKGSDGFIWIATANGLNRFDGYSFWQLDKQPGFKLSSNNISWLLEKDRILWVATTNGIDLVDLNSYTVIRSLRHTSAESSLFDHSVTEIHQSKDGRIWVLTSKGVLHRYEGGSRFERIYNPLDKNGSFGIRVHFAESPEHIWLKSEDKGVFQLDINSGKLISAFPETGTHIGDIYYHPKHGVLSLCKKGVKAFDAKQKKFVPAFPQIGNDVYEMAEDSYGNLWFVTNDGRRLIRQKNNVIQDVTLEVFNQSDNVRMHIVLLDNHSIWICTSFGLYQYTIKKNLFTPILTKEQQHDSSFIPSFRGMIEDENGSIYIGGYGGLFCYSDNKKVRVLLNNTIPYSPYKLINLDRDHLLAVTEGYGLIRINKYTGAVTQLLHQPTISDYHKYRYLYYGLLDKDSCLWISGYEGVFRYNPKTNQIFSVSLRYKDIDIDKIRVREFYRTKDDKLWLSTNLGIFVLDQNRKPVAHFHDEALGCYKIPVNTAIGVLEGKSGEVWLFTLGGGLCRFDPQKKRLDVINTLNGLADNHVVSGLEDNDNHLWVATNNGLSMIDLKTNQISNFYAEDGLSSNEFNAGSALKTRSGKLFWGGVDGINILDPGAYLKNAQTPSRLQVSKIEILNTRNETEEIYHPQALKEGLNTSYEKGMLNIDFFITDYFYTDKNKYKYRLEGFHENWIELGERHTIRFASLPVGEYTLVIRGVSSRGGSIDDEIRFPIVIHQVFYKTWWFALLLILLVGLIIYRIQSIKIEKLREIAKLRTSIASNLHDDVGSVLTRIAMQAELINANSKSEMQPILKSIIQSCQSALSNMRDVIWSIDARNLTGSNLFDKIAELTQQMFEYSTIQCELDFDTTFHEVKLTQLQKQELYFIVKEALHNVLKHSTGNTVKISASKIRANTLVLTVYNDGQTDVPSNYSGSGLLNMRARAKKINGQLEIDTSHGFLVRLILNHH